MRPIGLLYDHVTENFGDRAVCLAMSDALASAGVPHEVVREGQIQDGKYAALVIGGGHCLRAQGSGFYDRFRAPGRHILNAVGISEDVGSVEFLSQYRYVSVRSATDYARVSAVRPDAAIVPCPSLLLPGVVDPSIEVKDRTILIHMAPSCSGFVPRWPEAIEQAFPDYQKVLLAVNRYNNDQEYLYDISFYKGWRLIPCMEPRMLAGLFGHPNVHGLLTTSLHGTLFAYRQSKPFLALPVIEKIRSFLSDRGLSDRHWVHGIGSEAMKRALNPMTHDKHLEGLWKRDEAMLQAHMARVISECRAAIAESETGA